MTLDEQHADDRLKQAQQRLAQELLDLVLWGHRGVERSWQGHWRDVPSYDRLSAELGSKRAGESFAGVAARRP